MPRDHLEIAREHHHAGRLALAERKYRAILADQPDHPGALHWLGVLYTQANQPRQALKLLWRAAKLLPDDAAVQHNLGHALLAVGDRTQAIARYEKALSIEPDRVETMMAIATALLLGQRGGDERMALEHLRRARALGADSVELHHQIAVASLRRGDFDHAVIACRAALDQDPRFAAGYLNLGLAHRGRLEIDEARRNLEKAVEMQNGSPRAWQALAMLEAESGNWQRAADFFQCAIDLRPEEPAAHLGLAQAFEQLGRIDESIAAFREAARKSRIGPQRSDLETVDGSEKVARLEEKLTPSPESAGLHFALAAWKGLAPPSNVPQGSVIDLFDRYADRFDEHLQKRLGYQVPALIASTVARLPLQPPLDILDLGCGTGLCGPLLRPMAKTLTGIDLAPAMVEKAQSRQVYDSVLVADVVGFVQQSSQQFDLMVAADVLIYVGDLLPLFEASAGALRAGGAMVFTVEACAGERFRLQPTQRFAHSQAYVQRIAEICGFEVHGIDSIQIRLEAGKPVEGLLVTLILPIQERRIR